MLRELKIHGFKSIRQNTTVEFGKVNLFIGGNGVGKSNILEAIGVLSACVGREITSDELNKKGVRLSVPALFKAAFKNHTLRPNFDLKATWSNDINYAVSISAGVYSEELNFHSELLTSNSNKILGRSPHGVTVPSMGKRLIVKDGEIRPTRGTWDVFQHLLDEDVRFHLQSELSKFSQFAIYSPQTAFLRGTEIENSTVKPLGLNGGGLARAYSTLHNLMMRHRHTDPSFYKKYNEVFSLLGAPGWTSAVKVSAYNPEIVSTQVKASDSAVYFIDRFMNSKRNQLSAYDSSEGTLYLLFMIVLLMHPESPKILAIDNIDSALNPRITRMLLEAVIKCTDQSSNGSSRIGPEQIFLTSHNPTSLDAFDLFDDDQRIFVVARDDDGSTTITRLKPPSNTSRADWIKAKGGKNLSELWIEGKIKGALGL